MSVKKFKVMLDLGYQGFEKDYPCKELYLPKKKPRGGHLSEEEKVNNKLKAKDRIAVEHSLSGLKRYRVLSNRLRIKDFGHYNDILGVCAGLWNFDLSH